MGRPPLIDRMVALANGGRAAVALAALVLGGIPLFRLSPYAALKSLVGGANLPEETITSPQRFAEILYKLGEGGRGLYLRFQVWDLLNPILIAVAGAMLLGWLLKGSRRANTRWRFVVVFPVVALFADLVENLVISLGVATFPHVGVAGMALPVVTGIKFGAVMGMMASVALVALLWLRERLSPAGGA